MAAIKPNLNWTEPNQNPIVLMGPTDWLLMHDWTHGDEVIMCICRVTHAQQLAEAAWDNKKKPWTDCVPSELHKFEKVFSKEESQQFPISKPWDHAIELLPNAPLVLDCKVYPLSQAKQLAQDAFLKEHLEKNYIKSSKSPYAALFFFVKKKDGRLLSRSALV